MYLSKIAGCQRKSLTTWLVLASYSAWHFFTDGVFQIEYPWTGRLLIDNSAVYFKTARHAIFWINHELFHTFNDPGEANCDNWLFEGLAGIQVLSGPEHDAVKMLIENYSRKAMWAPSSGGYPRLDVFTTQRPTDASLYSLRQNYLIFKQ